MQIFRVDRAHADEARGIVIVIDVIRAFTVAGYAFAGGARGLWLVRTVEEAQELRKREPTALLIGEVGGRLIPGFNLNNSPARMAAANVDGRILIQRTGAGTQGAVDASHANNTLLCAFTNAQATATYAQHLAASSGDPITLFPTGLSQDFTFGDEDSLCADYIEALLTRPDDAPAVLQAAITDLQTSSRFDWWKTGDADFPFEDIAAVLAPNRFHFAISGQLKEWHGITYVDAERVELTSR